MLSCNSSFKGSRLIIERFHVFHVLHNHKRNLECDRIFKNSKIESRALLQLIQPIDKGISVYIKLSRGILDMQIILKDFIDRFKCLFIKVIRRFVAKNLFDEHFAQWDRKLVNQTADTQ